MARSLEPMGVLDRHPAGRWLLPVLVVLLLLGHVCDASALEQPAAHHAGDGQSGEQLGWCDPAPAASSSGQTLSWWAGGVPAAPPVTDAIPARPVGPVIDGPTTPADRLPLFLLHASLLI